MNIETKEYKEYAIYFENELNKSSNARETDIKIKCRQLIGNGLRKLINLEDFRLVEDNSTIIMNTFLVIF